MQCVLKKIPSMEHTILKKHLVLSFAWFNSSFFYYFFYNSKWWWASVSQSFRFFWDMQAVTNMEGSMNSWPKLYICWKPAVALPCRWRSRSSTTAAASPQRWCPRQTSPSLAYTPPLEGLPQACLPAWHSWDSMGMAHRLYYLSHCLGRSTSWACPIWPPPFTSPSRRQAPKAAILWCTWWAYQAHQFRWVIGMISNSWLFDY